MGIYEYVLFIMSHHYYIIYFLLMSYIYFLFESLHVSNELIIIRLVSIRKQYICRLFCATFQTICFVFAQVIVAFCIGIINLANENAFSIEWTEENYNDTLQLMLQYSRSFKMPLNALAITTVYMIFGLIFLNMGIYVVKNILNRKYLFIIVGILILDVMIGFKCGISGVSELFFFNNYFIFHHVFFQSGKLFVLVNLICIFIGIIILEIVLQRVKGNDVNASKVCLKEMYHYSFKYSILFLSVYVMMIFIYLRPNKNGFSAADILMLSIMGYNADDFSFFEFLRYIVFFMIPIFSIGVIIDSEKHMLYQHIAIRYSNMRIWKKQVNLQMNLYLFRYMLFFIMLLLLLSFCTSVDISKSCYAMEFIKMQGLENKIIYPVIIAVLLLKGLELVFYKNIFVLLCEVFENSTVAYIVVFFGFLVSIIFQNHIWISYGISSVYSVTKYMEQYGVMRALFYISMIICIKILGIKWLIRKVERGYGESNRIKKCIKKIWR